MPTYLIPNGQRIVADAIYIAANFPGATLVIENISEVAAPNWRVPLMAAVRAKRDTLLNVLDGIQIDAITVLNPTDATACKSIKDALKLIPELPSVVNATSAQELQIAVVMAYKAAVKDAPAGVLALFAGYLK